LPRAQATLAANHQIEGNGCRASAGSLCTASFGGDIRPHAASWPTGD